MYVICAYVICILSVDIHTDTLPAMMKKTDWNCKTSRIHTDTYKDTFQDTYKDTYKDTNKDAYKDKKKTHWNCKTATHIRTHTRTHIRTRRRETGTKRLACTRRRT